MSYLMTIAFSLVFGYLGGYISHTPSFGASVVQYTQGGTSTSTKAKWGDVFYWNGSGWQGLATSSLGLSGGSGTPGGSDTQIQYNNAGSFAGNWGLTYSLNASRPTLALGNLSSTSIQFQIGESVTNSWADIYGQSYDSSAYFDLYTSTSSLGGSFLDLYSDTGQVFAKAGSATTSLLIDTFSASQGSCIALKDRDGTGYTYLTVNNGTLFASVTDCR